jgi:AcrR family transcriptional regulator
MRIRADTPSRDGYHHGDLRHALLEAALALVSKQGVESFSLREAARAVGVSPAAAYRHFEDKAALLAALAVDGMGRLALAMEAAMARAPGAAGAPARAAADLAALGEAYVEFAVRHPSHFRVMFGPWCEHPGMGEVPPEARPNGRDPYQLLVDALDGLVRSGAISATARAGAEISAWATVHGLACLLVEGSLPLTAAERAQALAVVQRTLLLGLGCAPALVGSGAARAPRTDPRCTSRSASPGRKQPARKRSPPA